MNTVHNRQVQQIKVKYDSKLRVSEGLLSGAESEKHNRFARVAYLTLNQHGLIVDVDQVGAKWLGGDNKALIGQLFMGFVTAKYHADWQGYYSQLQHGSPQHYIELSLCSLNGTLFQVAINCLCTKHQFDGHKIQLAVINISHYQKLEMSANVVQTQAGVLIIDVSKKITAVNQGFIRLTGFEPDDMIGKQISTFHGQGYDTHFYQTLWSTVASTGFWQAEIWHKKSQAESFPAWLNVTQLTDEAQQLIGYVCLLINSSENSHDQNNLLAECEQLHEQLIKLKAELAQSREEANILRYHAEIDPLTKLPNRKLFFQQLDSALAQAKRFEDNLAVLYLDLDGFKQVNDKLGHGYGDQLLIEVGKRLQNCVREIDTIARLGGDEFVIVLNRTSKRMVNETAKRIIKQLNFKISEKQLILNVSVSIGIAIYPNDSINPLILLKYADSAMYKAKSKGKSQYCWHINQSKLIACNDK